MESVLHGFLVFLGASIIDAPLTGLLVWFVFWTLKGTSMAHFYKVMLSCGIVSVVLVFLSLSGGGTIHYGDLIWIAIWFVLFYFWPPKPKQPKQPT